MMTYESYRAALIAQDVRPLSQAAWERENQLSKPHTVEFTVTPEMARRGSLAPGKYRNHFGYDQRLLRTEKISAI
jgi:hypothetical protein